MKTIFIVKSFGSESGYMNLKAFDCEPIAEKYAESVKKQIPLEVLASGEEFVEIEELTLEEY
jgi:hypothetical protein